jgi:hypothetical protein
MIMSAKAGALNARQMSDMIATRIFTLRILLNHDFRFAIVARHRLYIPPHLLELFLSFFPSRTTPAAQLEREAPAI